MKNSKENMHFYIRLKGLNFWFEFRRRKIMTESVKDPHALVVTSQPEMLDKLQLSEVTLDP